MNQLDLAKLCRSHLVVLSLHNTTLYISFVDAALSNSTHQLARDAGFSTARDIRHAVMLRPDCDEIVYGGIVTALNIGAQELATLREPNGVESILQLWDAFELFTDVFNLKMNNENRVSQSQRAQKRDFSMFRS